MVTDQSGTKQTQLGRYTLLEKIGSGGFGTVYRARNEALGNTVAIKVLHPTVSETEEFLTRFRREAQEAARLDHPNIVRTFDLDEANGIHFIVMEFLDGGDLAGLIASPNLLELDHAYRVLEQVSAALDYAHAQGLVHRDVKPSNILLREDGLAKLTDFGAVKAAEGTRLTRPNEFIGTPAYMSPEQVNSSEVDSRSDIYSLGIVAFQLLTGQVPFEGDSDVATAVMQLQTPPPRPSTLSSRARDPVEPVLLKVLAKNPDERYQTCAAFTAALGTALADLRTAELEKSYATARTQLKAHDFTAALTTLDAINQINPAFWDVPQLLEQTRMRARLAEWYGEAATHLDEAEAIAERIQQEDPDFPDDGGVLKKLIPPSDPEPAPQPVTEVRKEAQQPAPPPPPRRTNWFQLAQAIGVTLAVAGYFGYWRVSSRVLTVNAWGFDVLSVDEVLQRTVVPAVAITLFLILLLVEWLGWRNVYTAVTKTAILAFGAIYAWWMLFSYFDTTVSSGAFLVSIGLTLAALGTVPRVITAVKQRSDAIST